MEIRADNLDVGVKETNVASDPDTSFQAASQDLCSPQEGQTVNSFSEPPTLGLDLRKRISMIRSRRGSCLSSHASDDFDNDFAEEQHNELHEKKLQFDQQVKQEKEKQKQEVEQKQLQEKVVRNLKLCAAKKRMLKKLIAMNPDTRIRTILAKDRYTKTKAELQYLAEWAIELEIPFFQSVLAKSPEAFENMCAALQVKTYAAKDVVLKQGDLATHYFVMVAGMIDVHVLLDETEEEQLERFYDENSKIDDTEKIYGMRRHTLYAGTGFGELGLDDDEHATRKATLIALSETVVLLIDKKTFRESLQVGTVQNSRVNFEFIKSQYMLNVLDPARQNLIAPLLTRRVFNRKHVILKQGKEIPGVFFIDSGHCILKVTAQDVPMEEWDDVQRLRQAEEQQLQEKQLLKLMKQAKNDPQLEAELAEISQALQKTKINRRIVEQHTEDKVADNLVLNQEKDEVDFTDNPLKPRRYIEVIQIGEGAIAGLALICDPGELSMFSDITVEATTPVVAYEMHKDCLKYLRGPVLDQMQEYYSRWRQQLQQTIAHKRQLAAQPKNGLFVVPNGKVKRSAVSSVSTPVFVSINDRKGNRRQTALSSEQMAAVLGHKQDQDPFLGSSSCMRRKSFQSSKTWTKVWNGLTQRTERAHYPSEAKLNLVGLSSGSMTDRGRAQSPRAIFLASQSHAGKPHYQLSMNLNQYRVVKDHRTHRGHVFAPSPRTQPVVTSIRKRITPHPLFVPPFSKPMLVEPEEEEPSSVPKPQLGERAPLGYQGIKRGPHCTHSVDHLPKFAQEAPVHIIKSSEVVNSLITEQQKKEIGATPLRLPAGQWKVDLHKGMSFHTKCSLAPVESFATSTKAPMLAGVKPQTHFVVHPGEDKQYLQDRQLVTGTRTFGYNDIHSNRFDATTKPTDALPAKKSPRHQLRPAASAQKYESEDGPLDLSNTLVLAPKPNHVDLSRMLRTPTPSYALYATRQKTSGLRGRNRRQYRTILHALAPFKAN